MPILNEWNNLYYASDLNTLPNTHQFIKVIRIYLYTQIINRLQMGEKERSISMFVRNFTNGRTIDAVAYVNSIIKNRETKKRINDDYEVYEKNRCELKKLKPSYYARLKHLIDSGREISAIKLCREIFPMGLMEARNMIREIKEEFYRESSDHSSSMDIPEELWEI